jgi:hypothetical protein
MMPPGTLLTFFEDGLQEPAQKVRLVGKFPTPNLASKLLLEGRPEAARGGIYRYSDMGGEIRKTRPAKQKSRSGVKSQPVRG